MRLETVTFHKVVTKGGSTALNKSDMQCSVSKSCLWYELLAAHSTAHEQMNR